MGNETAAVSKEAQAIQQKFTQREKDLMNDE